MYLKLFLRKIRHAFMRIFSPNAINGYEWKSYSQNGEDGILGEIFRRIGTTGPYFVEFGVEDGLECNTAFLARRKSWHGLPISTSATRRCGPRSSKNPKASFPP